MANTIDIVGKNIIFNINGADKFLSIKSKLVIPLSHVVSVSTDTAKWWTSADSFDLKIGGARLPSVVKDGRFFAKGKFYFYVMHDPAKCVTVNLDNERYSSIIFQVADKKAAAKKILSKIK
jgi:hypothetical protein